MPLPIADRTVFETNTLFGVSVQVRFTPILRIQVETPAAFQEKIRENFPGYGVVNPVALGLPADVPAEVQAAVRGAMQAGLGMGADRAHRFTSADGNWILLLAQESITMSCKKYPRWETYRDKFQSVFDPFISVYKPTSAAMVGLRYQNLIERSKLGLKDVPWSQVLKPFIAGEFACPGLREDEIVSSNHRFELIQAKDRIVVQHGTGINQSTKESVYFIDGNYNSLGKVELADVFSRLDALNKLSGSLYRLCIADRLYNSLKPVVSG